MRARSRARADAAGQLELVEKRLGRRSNFAVKCTAVGNVFLRLIGVHFSVSENIQPSIRTECLHPNRSAIWAILSVSCDENNHLKYESHLSGRKVPSVSEGLNNESATTEFWNA